MATRLKTTTLVMMIAMLPADLHAESDGSETNLRELCRKDLAGLYMTAFDLAEQARQQSEVLTRSLKALTTSEHKADGEFQTAKAAADKTEFDPNLAERRDITSKALRNIQEQIKEQQSLLQKAQSRYVQAQERERALNKSIMRLFNMTRDETRYRGGYPFNLEYRSTCPKYQFMCKLPATESKLLATLVSPEPTPEHCQKYASYSQAMPKATKKTVPKAEH